MERTRSRLRREIDYNEPLGIDEMDEFKMAEDKMMVKKHQADDQVGLAQLSGFEFLRHYVALQKGIMFDEVLDLGFATLCYSQDEPSPVWNNALVNTPLDIGVIERIEHQLCGLNRQPAFYYEDRVELQPLTDVLSMRGYRRKAEDAFMFFSGKGVDSSGFEAVRKVMTEQELEIFLEVMDQCYGKEDPLNPYGELGEYLMTARSAWQKHHASGRIEYFWVEYDQKPVAVATLTNDQGDGYISNIGALPAVRGQGFGKLATLYCVAQSLQNGNRRHYLATEEGSYANTFYKRLEFETRLNARLMVR